MRTGSQGNFKRMLRLLALFAAVFALVLPLFLPRTVRRGGPGEPRQGRPGAAGQTWGRSGMKGTGISRWVLALLRKTLPPTCNRCGMPVKRGASTCSHCGNVLGEVKYSVNRTGTKV